MEGNELSNPQQQQRVGQQRGQLRDITHSASQPAGEGGSSGDSSSVLSRSHPRLAFRRSVAVASSAEDTNTAFTAASTCKDCVNASTFEAIDSEYPRGLKRREALAASSSQRTSDASEKSSTAQKNAKKSKFKSTSASAAPSAPLRRQYNLRSSTESLQEVFNDTLSSTLTSAAAVITPRMPCRHHNNTPNGLESPLPPTSLAPPLPKLPLGMIDIFCNRTKTCQCPCNRCIITDTSLGFAHIRQYGEEYGELLRDAERKQMDVIQSLLPHTVCMHNSASNSVDNSSITSIDDFDDDPDLFSSQPSITISGSRCSASRSMQSRSSRCNMNLQDTFVAAHDRVVKGGEDGIPSRTTKLTEIEPERVPHQLVRQPYLTPQMRSILVHWLIEVGQEYKTSDVSFHLAVSILDCLLLTGPTAEELEKHDDRHSDEEPPWFLILRSEFQAVGCVCAWIASKLEDRKAPTVEEFVWISDYSFQGSQLRSLEERVCRELSFRISLVTPFHFVNLFLRASHACPSAFCEYDHPVLRSVVMYLLALSRLSYPLSICKPSLLAAAAVYLGRATLGIREAPVFTNDENSPTGTTLTENDIQNRCGNSSGFSGGVWSRTLEYYTGYQHHELQTPVLIIHRFQLAAEKSEHIKGIFTKFSTPAYHYASFKTALRVEDLGFEVQFSHDNLDIDAIANEPF